MRTVPRRPGDSGRTLLRRVSTGGADAPPRTKAELHHDLMQRGDLARFQKLLWLLLNPLSALDQHKWAACIEEIHVLFGLSKIPVNQLMFLTWENCSGAAPVSGMKSATRSDGVYVHQAGAASLPIRFDSIHGVKGETHAATLVVETFARQHDLKELLPALTAVQHGSQLRDSARGHCKRVFVGMSRPSHLLCLAISAEHINDIQFRALGANGWKLVKIQS
jgi:DNA helicase-2/ATP-dependent DNA helicase PcrA